MSETMSSTAVSPICQWDTARVSRWLDEKGVSEYIGKFAKAEIDGRTLLGISHKELTELGRTTDKHFTLVSLIFDLRSEAHNQHNHQQQQPDVAGPVHDTGHLLQYSIDEDKGSSCNDGPSSGSIGGVLGSIHQQAQMHTCSLPAAAA